MKSFPETILPALRSHRSCADAQRKDLSYPEMSAALVECFAENDRAMRFEGKNLNRQTALDRSESKTGAPQSFVSWLSILCGNG